MNCCLTFFYLLLFSAAVSAQGNFIRDNSFFFPHTIKNGTTLHTVSLVTAKLPEDVIESDDLFRAPLGVYRIKMGYLNNFTVNASAVTNVVANEISAGTQFNYEFNRLGISAGADAAYWFGFLNIEGFKTTTEGFSFYPSLSIGYTFPNFSVTFKSELLYILKQSTRHGEIKSENSYKTFSGYSFAFFIEQPLWDSHFVAVGIKGNFVKFYFPLWAALSKFDRFFYIPEFIFSLNL